MRLALSLTQAEAECRAACAHLQIGDTVQHIHHGRWLEVLTEPIANRIAFIVEDKPRGQKVERLHRMRPFVDADRQKPDADWQKAHADWLKAHADWLKAHADWQKVNADRQWPDADWLKAHADWLKAHADWQKADADRQKADASPVMLALHAEICGCPWSATTDIFGRQR